MIYLTNQFDIFSSIPDELLPFVTVYLIDQTKYPEQIEQLITDGISYITDPTIATFHNIDVNLNTFTMQHSDIAILISYRNNKYHYIAIEVCDDMFNTQFENYVQEITDDNILEHTENNVEILTNLCIFTDVFDLCNSVGKEKVQEFAPELLAFEYK